eukprot:367712_1
MPLGRARRSKGWSPGPFFWGVAIRDVAAGASHSVAVTASGTVFTWGLSTHGQLGLGSLAPTPKPTVVPRSVSFSDFVSAAAGHDHTLCLTERGTVYAWGRSHRGQLGLGRDGAGKTGSSAAPRLVSALFSLLTDPAVGPVVRIRARYDASVFLTQSGAVFVAGDGTVGQFGNCLTKVVHTPQRVQSLSSLDIVDASIGLLHVAYLTADGTVWAAGCNIKGQLGVEPHAALSVGRPELHNKPPKPP